MCLPSVADILRNLFGRAQQDSREESNCVDEVVIKSICGVNLFDKSDTFLIIDPLSRFS